METASPHPELADYEFVVQRAPDEWYVLDILQHEDKARDHYRHVWEKLASVLRKYHGMIEREPAPAWVSWKPGDWCEQQRGYEGRRKYVAWCGDSVVGFLNVWSGFPSQQQPGRSVLYVEHVATAPGSIETELWSPRYRGVGMALMAYAGFLSMSEGFEGRLGLHVAHDEAMGFYRRLQAKCGGTLFYPERNGVVGPTPHGENDRDRIYLESTEHGTKAWLEEYRRA